MIDPRWFQITVLLSLLGYGLAGLDLAVRPGHAAAITLAAVASQLLGNRWTGVTRFDLKSTAISVLSLCLLLRTSSWPWAAAAGALAIGSKYLVRVRGKHLWNPSNIAIVALLLASPALPGGVWVSPGQWGNGVILAAMLVLAGHWVVQRAARGDVTLAFLAAYVGLVLGRALWLGDPLPVPLNRLSSGSLLIFAFFMISDPKTTPDSRPGRLLFGALVATAGAWGQYARFEPNALLYALAAAAPLVPLLDRLLPAGRFQWPGKDPAQGSATSAPAPTVPLSSPLVERSIP
jgi:Na+-transporting NADH:ubiquinone oxidoreductase subunit NqrB